MAFSIKFQTNERLSLRDPEETVLGRSIVRTGLILMYKLGFEQFTFKKLAAEINTTEASIYRYFENKHRLLLYLLTWYWNYMEYLVLFKLNNLDSPEQKIRTVIDLLVKDLPEDEHFDLDKTALHHIVIAESSKTYLTKDVAEINQEQLFKPYKDLCARIGNLFQEYNPDYPFPRSLASTLLEMAHFEYYFMINLPSLTDFGHDKKEDNIITFLNHLVFSSLHIR